MAKTLFNKEELSDEEIEEWNQINRTEDLTVDLVDHMNTDIKLKQSVLDYLAKSATSWEQAILGAVAMGNYLLSKCWPDHCGYDAFQEFWLEVSELNSETKSIIDHAVNRALDEMIVEANAICDFQNKS